MTATDTTLERPPLSYEPTEWLDWLASQPNLTRAIDTLCENYSEHVDEMLMWAVRTRDRLERASDQAAKHLTDDDLPATQRDFWRGVQAIADPFSSLPAPNPDHDYTWRPGDAF